MINDKNMKNWEEKYQQNIDGELKSFFVETGKDKPSNNFTQNIISRAETNNLALQFYNKPVITKQWWFIIFSLLIFIVVFSATQLTPTETFDFLQNPFSFFSSNHFLQTFTVSLSSLTVTYLTSKWFLFFSVLIEISVLSFYLQQRLASYK